MAEQLIHIWHKCSHCGARPISNTRYHCTSCPAGPENDFCETCYNAFKNGDIEHPSIDISGENKTHTFIPIEGKTQEQYEQWVHVNQPNVVSPSIPHGFLVRPEFRSGHDSYFGSHGFVVKSEKGNLLITALHVLDELIKKVMIDTTAANENYTGKELPRYINSVNLYNVLEDKWMFFEMGTAGPMMVLPDARTDDEEPYSYRDIAAFLIEGNCEIKLGRLASVTPDIGEPVWLAAKLRGSRNIHQAVVVEKTERTFIFRYKESTLDLKLTSGAPILNKNGEVVGINIGAGFYKEQHFGHANHVENIRWHLKEGSNPRG